MSVLIPPWILSLQFLPYKHWLLVFRTSCFKTQRNILKGGIFTIQEQIVVVFLYLLIWYFKIRFYCFNLHFFNRMNIFFIFISNLHSSELYFQLHIRVLCFSNMFCVFVNMTFKILLQIYFLWFAQLILGEKVCFNCMFIIFKESLSNVMSFLI